jgi:hypothetical protein
VKVRNNEKEREREREGALECSRVTTRSGDMRAFARSGVSVHSEGAFKKVSRARS